MVEVMKKIYIFIVVIILGGLFIVKNVGKKNNKLFENVCYINYKITTENGIVEDEMSSNEVNDFIELINNLQLEEVKESEMVKGWFVLIECYDERNEYMYNAYLIGDLFYIDNTGYYVDEDNLKKLHQFINKMIK